MNDEPSTNQKVSVTLIPGDGIGPEVVRATQQIIHAAGAKIDWEVCEAGAVAFKKGLATGVPQETIASIEKTRVALKGPLETPVGYGEKSANVTLRKFFETYGNLRPVREMPGVKTRFSGSGIDLTVVRENVEDLYAGIEHMQTPGVAQCLKLMSRKGCEKIVRLAFEVARAEGRKSVHCATKANIMKLTEGLMKRTFEEVAREYQDIAAHHIIVDNCAHQLVRFPEQFEVIVTSNMNGDILSDLTSGLIGGLGFAPGANIGADVTIFEAVHGSAPSIAGKNMANPTAVLLSAVMMLRHLGHFAAAQSIELALMATLEQGTLTCDVAAKGHAVSTSAFAEAVIANVGRRPQSWQAREMKKLKIPALTLPTDTVRPTQRRTAGVDVFIESAVTADVLGRDLEALAAPLPVKLKMVSNRGAQVYPAAGSSADCVDHWRCRFVTREGNAECGDTEIITLLQQVSAKHRWMHVEKLYEFEGKPAYSKAQGED
jgi:isocitrate dehydrogenase